MFRACEQKAHGDKLCHASGNEGWRELSNKVSSVYTISHSVTVAQFDFRFRTHFCHFACRCSNLYFFAAVVIISSLTSNVGFGE